MLCDATRPSYRERRVGEPVIRRGGGLIGLVFESSSFEFGVNAGAVLDIARRTVKEICNALDRPSLSAGNQGYR